MRLFERHGVKAMQSVRAGIDGDSRIFEGDNAEDWLGLLGPEDNLRDGLGTHKADAGKAVLHLDGRTVGQFVHAPAFGTNPGGFQPACRRKAVDCASIDEEFGFIPFTAPGETSNLGCDVCDAHGEETMIVGGASADNERRNSTRLRILPALRSPVLVGCIPPQNPAGSAHS